MTTASISRASIDSSSLASIGYSPEQHILEAEFRRGDVYRFFMVPREVYDQLLSAESKGRYFNSFIKGRFPFAKQVG